MPLHSETWLPLHLEKIPLHWETKQPLHLETKANLHWAIILPFHWESKMPFHLETKMPLCLETKVPLHWEAGFPLVPIILTLHLQGVFFYWSPLNFLSTTFLYNLWHLKKFWASFNGIWDSAKFRGDQSKKSPCMLPCILITSNMHLYGKEKPSFKYTLTN